MTRCVTQCRLQIESPHTKDYNHPNSLKRPCPICSNSQRELLFCQRFESIKDVSLIDGYEVVVCRNCGLVFADGIPSKEVFNRYYLEASKYEFSHRGGKQHDFRTATTCGSGGLDCDASAACIAAPECRLRHRRTAGGFAGTGIRRRYRVGIPRKVACDTPAKHTACACYNVSSETSLRVSMRSMSLC